jgi:penicillin-binding protein 1C
VILAANAKLPAPLQRFRPGLLAGDGAEPPVKIIFPPDGARLEMSMNAGKAEPIALKIAGGVEPLSVMVNGLPLAETSAGKRVVFFEPSGAGFVRLTVTDAKGAVDSVLVRIQ